MPYAPQSHFDPSLIFQGIAGAGQSIGSGIADAKKKREEAEAQMAGSWFGFNTLSQANLISDEEKTKFLSGNANQRNAIVMSATPRLLQKFQEKKEANEQAYRMQELAMRQQMYGARMNPQIDPNTGMTWNGRQWVRPYQEKGGIPMYSRANARGTVGDDGKWKGDPNGNMAQVVTPAGKQLVVPWEAYQRSQGQGQAPAAQAPVAEPELPSVAAPPQAQAATAIIEKGGHHYEVDHVSKKVIRQID